MIVIPSSDFNKSIKKLTDQISRKRLSELIKKLEKAQSLDDISNVEPLTNNPLIYRIRTGNFRLVIRHVKGSIEILLIEYIRRNEKTYRDYN